MKNVKNLKFKIWNKKSGRSKDVTIFLNQIKGLYNFITVMEG